MIAVALVLIAVVVIIWLIGAREPVYRLHGVGSNWFVTTRNSGEIFAPGARVLWRAETDFALIGAKDAYWSRFYIVQTNGGPPLRADAVLDDAFVARIQLFKPPKLALGLLRTLAALGVLTRPKGQIAQEAQHLGHRRELMPSDSAIARLLAQPQSYSPAMVNFLRYNEHGGAAAYRKYGVVALRTVYRTGGALLFYARVLEITRQAQNGPTLGAWDDLAAMRYPDPSAILSMEHAPDYRAALHHRDKGLAATVVIASHELSPN